MSEELKPCPFCGGKAELYEDHYQYTDHSAWIRCTNCFIHTQTLFGKNEVIQQWNTRVEKVCRWAPNTRIGFGWTDDDYWETGCGTAFTVIDHLPLLDKEFLYCPKCGGRVEVVE